MEGDMNDLWSSFGFYPESPIDKAISFPLSNDPNCVSEFMSFDEANFNEMQSPGKPNIEEDNSLMSEISELLQPKEKKRFMSFSSLELLNKYKTNCNRLSRERNIQPICGRKLSTEEVVRVAAAHFIQLSSLVAGDPSKVGLPFGLSLSSLTTEEVKDVELGSLLMAAAEKVINQQYDRANILLRQCYMLSSNTGNPVQRVVYYFYEALQERVNQETRKVSLKGLNEMNSQTSQELMKAILTNHSVHVVANNTLPFTQALQFTSIQAILDNMAKNKKIHMIDLSIRHGFQWTVLMQALATRQSCPIALLKISAVGMSAEAISPVGKRLSSFAESLNLPFKFKSVIVPDMKDLREDMFDLGEVEALGIYSDLIFNSLIVKPESLENLMRVIQNLNPCIMTVIEIEAKLNSKSFIDRFTEALFFYSTFFDCLDNLMERTDENRRMIEEGFFSQAIKSILTAEGSERVIRLVGISVWRSFFMKFGLEEVELSEMSLYQANLLVNNFVKDGSCTLERDGKSLLIEWKGTPLHFVSAWKFKKGKKVDINEFNHPIICSPS